MLKTDCGCLRSEGQVDAKGDACGSENVKGLHMWPAGACVMSDNQVTVEFMVYSQIETGCIEELIFSKPLRRCWSGTMVMVLNSAGLSYRLFGVDFKCG